MMTSALRYYAHFATMHGPMSSWLRQTPAGNGWFGKTWFSEHTTGISNEWLVVCDEPPKEFRTRVPISRRILFVGEPLAIKTYQASYLNQFGWVVGPMPLGGFNGTQLRQHGCLPWHYGKHRPASWQELLCDKQKSRDISVFCSDKVLTRQQELRIRFVEDIKVHFGALVTHFGNGFETVAEKADGLDAYRYTIVLENNDEDSFWTEKLSDAYLGHCFPIYCGGDIPSTDFDPAARLNIDINQRTETFGKIYQLLLNQQFEKSEHMIREQRRRVMFDHNLFSAANRIIGVAAQAHGLLPRPEGLHQSYEYKRDPLDRRSENRHRLWRRMIHRLL